VAIIAVKGARYTDYLKRGTTKLRRLKADFGELGTVNLTFYANGRQRDTTPKNCSGGKQITRYGKWTGKLVFRGEGGYTLVNRTKIPGSISSHPDLKCHMSGSGGGSPYGRHLSAYKGVDLRFTAYASQSGGLVHFTAFRIETKNGIQITRNVNVSTGTFSSEGQRDKATVVPGAPFTGQGNLEPGPSYFAPSWTGTLAVKFLGEDSTTPLAGTGWTSEPIHSY
jgi:hypothetical protein